MPRDYFRTWDKLGDLRHKITSHINPLSIGKEEPAEEVHSKEIVLEDTSDGG